MKAIFDSNKLILDRAKRNLSLGMNKIGGVINDIVDVEYIHRMVEIQRGLLS